MGLEIFHSLSFTKKKQRLHLTAVASVSILIVIIITVAIEVTADEEIDAAGLLLLRLSLLPIHRMISSSVDGFVHVGVEAVICVFGGKVGLKRNERKKTVT